MIYKLDETSKKDVLEVGGKAANLGELIKLPHIDPLLL